MGKLALTLAFVMTAAWSQEPTVTLPPELARVLTDYEAGWRAKDSDALAKLFSEDGFVLSPGEPMMRGRKAIEQAGAPAGGGTGKSVVKGARGSVRKARAKKSRGN